MMWVPSQYLTRVADRTRYSRTMVNGKRTIDMARHRRRRALTRPTGQADLAASRVSVHHSADGRGMLGISSSPSSVDHLVVEMPIPSRRAGVDDNGPHGAMISKRPSLSAFLRRVMALNGRSSLLRSSIANLVMRVGSSRDRRRRSARHVEARANRRSKCKGCSWLRHARRVEEREPASLAAHAAGSVRAWEG